MTGVLARLEAVIAADQAPLPAPARAMAEAIGRKHGGAVRALIFYGSALREEEGAGKMLDFYVIVESYRAIYGRGPARWAAALLPPGVHFLQVTGREGQILRSKYAVVSEAAFHRRTRGGAFETMLWARFTQPALIITESPETRARLITTLAMAVRHFAREVRPLLAGPVPPGALWERGLAESYRTELRPEAPQARARAIVARFPARYAALSEILQGDPLAAESVAGPGGWAVLRARMRWRLRRVLGKPLGALRVLKAATTFDAGLDYVLEKVASHSGVRLEVSDHARRHPLLHAPVLAWRLYRAGAFR